MSIPAGVVLLEPNGPRHGHNGELDGLDEALCGLNLHDPAVATSMAMALSLGLPVPGGVPTGSKHVDPAAMSYASLIKSFATVGDETGAEDVIRRLRDQKVQQAHPKFCVLVNNKVGFSSHKETVCPAA
jgi:hypothetical protein